MRLSAIDHNHHSHLQQAKDSMANLLYRRRWSKKTGKWIPVKVPEKKTYSYILYLMATAFESREKDVLPTYIHTYIKFLIRQVCLWQPKGWCGPAVKKNLNT